MEKRKDKCLYVHHYCSHILMMQSMVYRGLETTVKNKLQTAKNRMIRYLFKYDCRHHIGYSDFKKSSYLAVKIRLDYLGIL